MKEKLLKEKEKLSKFINGIIKSIFKFEDLNDEQREEEKRIKSIQDAHKEWMEKEEYFKAVSDSDLVDFAIYDIEASKRKYTYLLKKFKKERNV